MSKKMFKSIMISIVLMVISLSGFSYKVFAASGRAISLSPTDERIILTPGEIYRSGFKIVNPANNKSNLNYSTSIGSYSTESGPDGKDDYGSADIETISGSNEIMNWTTINNPTGTILPSEDVTLSYTINVPDDAPAGGQYMTILVKENPDFDSFNDGGSVIKENMQMAFVVYAEVTGNTRKEGAILENNIPGFLLNNKLEASSRIRNNGNVHTDAEVVLQVWPLFSDEEICTNEENASITFILPETERYHTEICTLPSVGIFRAKQTVKIFGEVSELEKTIIVCPLWLLFIIIFAIAALIIWLVVKAKGRKASRK